MAAVAHAAPISLSGVSKRFGEPPVIEDLSVEFKSGQFSVILGPSGCGNTTLPNLIAGLERVSGGKIHIGGQEVRDTEPRDQSIAVVFQAYALYPHMDVAGNIGYALRVARVPKAERQKWVEAAARTVGLSGFLSRRPSQLSGGQRQRVAIARASVRETRDLLYDESLSNLDVRLRAAMRIELSELHKRIGATSMFVAHHQAESMTRAQDPDPEPGTDRTIRNAAGNLPCTRIGLRRRVNRSSAHEPHPHNRRRRISAANKR